MLQPKIIQKKMQKRKIKGYETKIISLIFGSIGIKSVENKRIKSNQLEAIRNMILKKTKKFGQFWFRFFPWQTITKKPIETRMGKGKSFHSYWCSPVKAGRILLEFYGISNIFIYEIFKLIKNKLPLHIKLIKVSH